MQVPETEIIVSKDGAELLRKTLRPGEYVIGRGPGCKVQVEVEGVALRHAQLTVNFDHALIADLGSDSGTLVNGKPIKEATRLWPNQKIQVGTATVELRRLKTVSDADQALPPHAAAMRRMLPEEFLRDKKYDIGGVVAQGAMGVILNAREATTERTVAMKVMLGGSGPDDLVRFVAEAKVTAQLEHPNIVPVHELSVDENEDVFYTMKFVKGVTLGAVLGKLREGDAATVKNYRLGTLLTIFQKVCDAVAFAHSKRVIHRDLKPDNTMLGDFGEVLVMDWGLAKVLDPSRPTPAGAGDAMRSLVRTVSREDLSSSATMAGSIVGTPQYMSPEQARGEIDTLDARSDIYALGAILYHLLTLCTPIDGQTLDEVLARVRAGKIIPPVQRVMTSKGRRGAPVAKPAPPDGGTSDQAPTEDPEPRDVVPETGKRSEPDRTEAHSLPHLPGGSVPASLNAVVLKAMAFEKEQRYPRVADLQRDIESYQTGFATRAENASLMKQFLLFVKRHKGVVATAVAAWLVITALAVWFVINLRASERKALHNAQVAAENERRAEQNAEFAAANEQEAVERGEATRRALAQSQNAVAEAAFREQDEPAMHAALDAVPEDLRDSTWNYLLGQSDTSLATLRSHSTFDIRSAAPDPRMPGVFAIVGADSWVALVEVRTGARLMEFPIGFKDKNSNNYCLAFSPDGGRLAIGRISGGIVIYSTREGKKLAEWESSPGMDSLAFSPDGQQVLEVGQYKQINLWEAGSGRLLWNRPDPTPRAVFTSNGQLILASSKASLNFLKVTDGTVAREFPSGRTWINSLAIKPDGTRAWLGDAYGFLRSVDLKDGHVIFETHANNDGVTKLAYLPDGDQLVTLANLSGNRLSVQVWDADRGTLLRPLLGAASNSSSFSVHPVSEELVVSSGARTKVWDLSWRRPKLRSGGGATNNSICFWQKDAWLFVGSQLLNLEAAKPLEQPIWKTDGRYSVCASSDGRFAAVSMNSQPYTTHLLRMNGQSVEEARAFDVPTTYASLIALNPTGKLLLKGSAVVDPVTGVKLLDLEGSPKLTFYSSAWLNETQVVAAVTAKAPRGQPNSEEQLNLWDATTGKLLRTVINRSPIFALAVAPDGKSIAEAGMDKMVRLRDPETLEVTREFRAHNGPINALVFHPKRPILATCSEDMTIKLWNLDADRLLDEWRGPTTPPRLLAFSPSGKLLACGAKDQTAWVWEPDSLKSDAVGRVDANGWEDLLVQLKRDEVAKSGHGWMLNGGALISGNKPFATIALPGNFARSSYQVRVKLRQLTSKEGFHLALPVADRMTAFELDANSKNGFFTGLQQVDGKPVAEVPGAVKGEQVKDPEQHDLEAIVRLGVATARITVTLDGQPIYEWAGPNSTLSQVKEWATTPPGNLAFGTSAADWVVYSVKVKRLEK